MACFFKAGRKTTTIETNSIEKTASLLEDVVKINNDRIEGYEKAMKNLKPEDSDLRMIFLKAITQSRAIRVSLGTEIQVLGNDIPTGASASGSIPRAWLEVTATFTGHGRRAILESCEFGEDAAQKAYQSVLSSEHLADYLSGLILEQKDELKDVHNEIKALRDQSK